MADVASPVPSAGEVLVDVHHVSLNLGDLNDARSGRVPPGAVLGSDVAGVVVESGTRVVGLTAGAFAERVVVAESALAVVPDGVSLAHAAALPVAGLAALQSLRAAGVGAGTRVLVTGASGGVGRFAVRLAAHAGASVIASVESAARAAGLDAEVVVGLDGVSEVDVVIDNVGGPQLVAAWGLLAPGGNVQSIGWSSGEPAAFPAVLDGRAGEVADVVPHRSHERGQGPRGAAGAPGRRDADRGRGLARPLHGLRNRSGSPTNPPGSRQSNPDRPPLTPRVSRSDIASRALTHTELSVSCTSRSARN